MSKGEINRTGASATVFIQRMYIRICVIYMDTV